MIATLAMGTRRDSAAATTPRLGCTLYEPPEAEKRLCELLARGHVDEWSANERLAVDTLIEELVALRQPWESSCARGKWRLAYLQPAALAKRPSPMRLSTPNQQYQVLSNSAVVNVAELLGPQLEIRAAGAWREDDPDDARTPKRFRADLTEGALCASITMGRVAKANIGRACVPLPLRGETYRVFEGQYVSPRLRIGRDLNSGGERLVQVRVSAFDGR